MTIHIAIAEDHQGIIDGYLYRLSSNPEMKIVGTALHGLEIAPMLASHPVDVLLLDIKLAISSKNRALFQTLQAVPQFLRKYPGLNILVVSMETDTTLIQAFMDVGVRGYIFKDDQASIQKLAGIIQIIAQGGMYFSPEAERQIHKRIPTGEPVLTKRQLELLTLVASEPDLKTTQIATRMGVAHSTIRNLLTRSYGRLKVRTRAAALARLRQLGLIPDNKFDSKDARPKP